LPETHRHVRILADLANLASESISLARYLDTAAIQVARSVGIAHVKILRYRAETADLLIEGGFGWKEGTVGSVSLPSDLSSPPGLTYQTALPLAVSDCSEAKGLVLADVLKEHGIVALCNVPILIDGAAWGVLEVDSAEPRVFDEEEIDFMRAAAAVIGMVVRRDADLRRERDSAAEVLARAQTRDVLLREMQHRVKNNFQMILASVALQQRRLPGSEVQRALDHVANRISAISLAHDQLAPRDDQHVVDLAGYIRALAASIEQQSDGVAIEVVADEVELPIDRAVPLGLIVNEAATNSVKHAFGKKGGRITVKLTAGIGYGEARLTIADNGSGFDGTKQTKGSGLKLMSSLAQQAGADFARESGALGTTISVTFPVVG